MHLVWSAEVLFTLSCEGLPLSQREPNLHLALFTKTVS